MSFNMSHLSDQDESNRPVDKIPSRSMSREENIEFDEKLNSRIFDYSPCSSVSGESDLSDSPPPPPPPLDDDFDCSDCGNPWSDINDYDDDRVTVGTNANQNTAVARDDGESGNEGNCSVKWEHGDYNYNTTSPFRRSTCKHSPTDVSYKNQLIVALEIDDNIDENCDHCSVEHEECSHVIDSTSCRSICRNSAADCGSVIQKPAIECDDDNDDNDKNIDASSGVGWGHGDYCHTNVVDTEDDKCDLLSLIEPVIPRFERSSISLERNPPAAMDHRSHNSSLTQLSKRSMHLTTQSALGNALIDPPTSDEDGNARGSYLGHHQSVLNHTLRTCFLILKKFALRCAFDHWRRKTNYEQTTYSTPESLSLAPHDNLGVPLFLSSNHSISSSILSPDAFSITSLRSLRRRPLSSCHVSLPVQIQLSHRDGTNR